MCAESPTSISHRVDVAQCDRACGEDVDTHAVIVIGGGAGKRNRSGNIVDLQTAVVVVREVAAGVRESADIVD